MQGLKSFSHLILCQYAKQYVVLSVRSMGEACKNVLIFCALLHLVLSRS